MMKKAKEVQQEVIENAHKVWLAGLGAFAAAQEESAEFLKNLMERGEEIEAKGKEQLEKAKGAATGVKTVAESYWETFGQTIDETVTKVIKRAGVPTKAEIKALNKKVAELTKAVEALKKSETKPVAKKPAPKKTATRKTAAKKATTTRKTTAKKTETK